MSLREYTIFDESLLPTGLELEQGGVVLVTDSPALDYNRTARSTFSQELDNVAVEFIIYGDAITIANKVAIGVGTADHSLTTVAGSSADSIAYHPAEGTIRLNNATLANVAVGAIGDVVQIIILRSGAEKQINFYLGTTLLYTYTVDLGCPALPLSDDLYWMVSLGSVEGGDIKVFVNSGAQQFETATTLADGFYRVATIDQPARFSDLPYVSHPTDSLPSIRWSGVLEPTDVIVDRGVTFWIWGNDASARGSTFSFTVVDEEGLLDGTLDGSYRDQSVTLQLVDPKASLSTAESLGSFIVEDVQVVDELRRKVVCLDALATYEVPMQRRYYRPDFDEQAAFRPWSTMLGAVFSAELTLIDGVEFTYALDSIGVANVGKVRDKGSPFSTMSSPADFTVNDGGQTITLRNQPVGIITLDAEVSGATFSNPVGNDSPTTDILDDFGNPFRGDTGTGDIEGWDEGRRTPLISFPKLVTGGRVRFPQNFTRDTYITRPNIAFTAGVTYRYRITVTDMPGIVGSSTTARFLFSAGTYTSLPPDAFLVVSGSYDGSSGPTPFPLTFEGTFTLPTNRTGLTIWYDANDITSFGDFDVYAEISLVQMEVVPVIDPEAEDDIVEDSLTPMSLHDMALAMIEERGRLPSTSWDASTFAAIDTASGYAGSGFYSTEQVTVRTGLNEVLRGYTAGLFRGLDGKIKAVRLVAPENETATKTVSTLDFMGPPLPRIDKAPGYTRRLGVRRNERILTDSDLVTDDIQVTMRLRRKLGRQHRFICTYGGPLAPVYAPAEAGDPLDTHLVKRADGDAETQRVGAMLRYARCFYDIPLAGRSDLEIGEIVEFTYDGFGFENGKNLFIVRIRENKLTDEQTITAWGLAP